VGAEHLGRQAGLTAQTRARQRLEPILGDDRKRGSP